MHVAHLSLTDFRSYPQVELPLGPGTTALVGPNGQGKTNLVEAVGYVAGLASHRVASDAPLVRAGCERAVVRASVVRGDRTALVEIEVVPGRANRARVNRSPVPRPREVLGLLRTVLFAPEDLQLVKGEPEHRRRALDELVVARSPRFAGVRADYDRVLRQRNAALKHARTGARAEWGSTLDVWDSHLAALGAELLAARLRTVHDLQPLVAEAYEAVSGGQGAASTAYRSTLGDDVVADPAPDRQVLAARLAEAVARARSQEVDRGTSLVGPHRDDVVLHLGDLPAKGYASHGESWSFALALRLASWRLLTADSASGEGEPVLVLDDVFAELDAGRRQRLAELVAPAEQVLVTAAVAADVPEQLQGARVDVMGSEVRRVL